MLRMKRGGVLGFGTWAATSLVVALLLSASPGLAGGTDITLETKNSANELRGGDRAKLSAPTTTLPTQRTLSPQRREQSPSWSAWIREMLSLLLGERFRFFGTPQP